MHAKSVRKNSGTMTTPHNGPSLSALVILHGVLASGGDTLTYEEACAIARTMVKTMIAPMRTPINPKPKRKPTVKRHLKLVK